MGKIASVRLQGRHDVSQKLVVLGVDFAGGYGELVVMSTQATEDALKTV